MATTSRATWLFTTHALWHDTTLTRPNRWRSIWASNRFTLNAWALVVQGDSLETDATSELVKGSHTIINETNNSNDNADGSTAWRRINLQGCHWRLATSKGVGGYFYVQPPWSQTTAPWWNGTLGLFENTSSVNENTSSVFEKTHLRYSKKHIVIEK